MAAMPSVPPMFRALPSRRPTRTELAVGAMALLLGVLAVMQYHWVGQLSTDERERLSRRLDRQAEELADDFNLEITRAFFSLQWGAELRRDLPLEADVDPGFDLADETQVPRLVSESLDQALRICRAIARDNDDVALVYAQLGDKELAFKYLDAAFDHRAPGLVFLNVDPAWETVRGEARFAAAVRRVGLP